MEKYCRAGQATDGNKIQRMRIACCIPKGKDTNSEYVIINAFPLQQYYVTRPLPVLLIIRCAGNENDEQNYVACTYAMTVYLDLITVGYTTS